MNLHQLRVFYQVAMRMSFSMAASDLFMSQPSVSLQVRSLERSLGVKLFERSMNQLRLTEAGEALVRSAEVILHAEDEAQRTIEELRGINKGKLVVGTNTTGGMYVLPRILRAFRRVNPGVQLNLEIDVTDQICERVTQNIIDLAFVGGPIQDRRLTVESILRDEVVLIASPDNTFAPDRHISLESLATQTLIVQEPKSRTRQLVERRLREAGLNVRPSMQLNGTEAVKKAVEGNLGVAFVSCYAIECELAAGSLVQLTVDSLRIEREYVLLHRSRKYLTPAATELQRFIREFASQHLSSPVGRHP